VSLPPERDIPAVFSKRAKALGGDMIHGATEFETLILTRCRALGYFETIPGRSDHGDRLRTL
jgi:hypothetical protein